MIEQVLRRYSICLALGGALLLLPSLPSTAGASPLTPSSADLSADTPDTAADFQLAAAESAQTRRASRSRRTFRVLDYDFAAFRLGLLVAGLVLIGWSLYQGPTRAARFARARRAGLVALALLSFGSYYYFFQLNKPGGFDLRDTYHYYLASKYAPELGYFRLYDCSLSALAEDSRAAATPHGVRNMRTLRIEGRDAALERGRSCPGDFAPERWAQFKYDVAWFRDQMSDTHWARMLLDHGYNPTPVWTALLRPISSATPVDAGWFPYIVRIDRFLIAVSFLCVGWAFGIDVAALMVLAWGSCFLWRYSWAGDAYVRHLWFAALVVGLCCLRKRAHFSSGLLLVLSALLRIFPGAFIVGYGGFALREVWRRRGVPPPVWRFAAGLAVGGVILLSASTLVLGRGVDIFPEFASKIAPFSTKKGFNKVGLPVLSHQIKELGAPGPGGAQATPDQERVVAHPALPVVARLLQLCLLAFLLSLWWKAIPGAQDWEFAVLGCTLIPILTQPTNYYYPFLVSAALLTTRRPRIGLGLLAACLAWGVNGLYFYQRFEEFVGASLIAVFFSFFVAWEMARPGQSSPSTPAVAP